MKLNGKLWLKNTQVLNQWKKQQHSVLDCCQTCVLPHEQFNKWVEEKMGLRDPSQVGEKSSLKLGF